MRGGRAWTAACVAIAAAGAVGALRSPAPHAAPVRDAALCSPIDTNALRTTPYRFQYGLSGNDLQSAFFDKATGLNGKGYRPVRLTGYRSGDEQVFATKWVKSGGPEWIGKFGLSGDGFHANYLALRGTHRPIDVSGYNTPSGATRYAVLWERNTAGVAWKEHRDVSRSGMQDLVDEYSRTGYVPVRVEAYQVGSSLRYISLWVKDSCAWRMHNKLTRDEYQERLDSYAAEGYRLVHLDSFRDGSGTYYAGVWWKQSGPSQSVRSNRDWYLFQRFFNNYKCDGRVIENFYAADLPGAIRYGGIWTSSGATPASAASPFDDRVVREVECAPARAGAAILNLTTGEEILSHGDATYGTSSTIKSAILYAILRRLDRTSENLDTKLNVGSQYGENQGDTLKANKSFTIRELVTTMIDHSNNWATNRLIDWVGRTNVNNEVAALGAGAVRLQRYMRGTGAPGSNAYFDGTDNVATPRQFVLFLRRVHQNNGLLTQASWDFFWATLGLNGGSHDDELDAGVGTSWRNVVTVAEKAGSNSWSDNPATKPQIDAHIQRSAAGRLMFANGNVVFYAAFADESDGTETQLQNMLDCVVMQAVRQYGGTTTGADVPTCQAG